MKNIIIFLFLAIINHSTAQDLKLVKVRTFCDSTALASNFLKFKPVFDTIVKAPYRFMIDWRYFEMEIRTERSMRLDEVQKLFLVIHDYRAGVFKLLKKEGSWRLRLFDYYVVTDNSQFKIEYNQSSGWNEEKRNIRIATRIDYK